MARALDGFVVAGVTTNLAFLKALIGHPKVARGDIDTGFIEREIAALAAAAASIAPLDLAGACVAVLVHEQGERVASGQPSPWDRSDGWTLAGARSRRLSFRRGTERFDVALWYRRDGLTMQLHGDDVRLQFAARDRGTIDLCLGDAPERVSAAWSGRELDLTTPRGRIALHWVDPFAAEIGEVAAASRIVAPMPGTVTRILAQPGTDLSRGTPLLVLEAMKMEHTLRAPADGHLKALKCAVGDFVQEGTELADFEPAAERA